MRIRSTNAQAVRTKGDPDQRNALLDELVTATWELAGLIVEKEGRLNRIGFSIGWEGSPRPGLTVCTSAALVHIRAKPRSEPSAPFSTRSFHQTEPLSRTRTGPFAIQQTRPRNACSALLSLLRQIDPTRCERDDRDAELRSFGAFDPLPVPGMPVLKASHRGTCCKC